jgi:2-iminobutanoate/2-iminopropanoate deaminase
MTAFGPYSPITQAGNYYFVSGQTGVDPVAQIVSPDVVEQTHQALKNLDEQLATCGLRLGHVVKTTVFLTRMDDFASVNEAYAAHFDDNPPARSCVAVAELPRVGGDVEILVEIEAVAYKKGTGHE